MRSLLSVEKWKSYVFMYQYDRYFLLGTKLSHLRMTLQPSPCMLFLNICFNFFFRKTELNMVFAKIKKSLLPMCHLLQQQSVLSDIIRHAFLLLASLLGLGTCTASTLPLDLPQALAHATPSPFWHSPASSATSLWTAASQWPSWQWWQNMVRTTLIQLI